MRFDTVPAETPAPHRISPTSSMRRVDTPTNTWIGNPFLDKFQRARPAFLNSTGLMQPSVEWILRLLYRWT